MEKDYQIITAESYSEFKKEANEFFQDLSDQFLWHFWNEIEKSANKQDNLFDVYHRRADETFVTTLADTTIFSDYAWLEELYSDDYPYAAFLNVVKNLIYALLPVKEAFLIIYMPKEDKFSERELSYIGLCLCEICKSIRLLCVIKETTIDMRLEIHVTRSR